MLQHTLSSTAVPSAPTRLTTGGPVASPSPEGIGDVMDAGRRSGYAHLGERHLPTLGRLVSAARDAAAALRATPPPPARHGYWRPIALGPHGHAVDGLHVTAVGLEPDGFVSASVPRPDRPHGMEVLYLIDGQAHLIVSDPGGRIRSASGLSADRVRVVAAEAFGGGEHHLVNTGDRVAVVVRVTA
ncbi:hypothetical protein [Nocardiopsis sp. ATB16-24]|uniref:hypothetical protein n=1 Tax=Nocardiopsis sp. ATB16-24 TaxID=3019555 RepID=UPI0025572871|nr:hypothetical protein [Nocardiopsis sp. ATB16-24]